MPKNRYERREVTHSWEDIRPLLKDSAQTTYEVTRLLLLFGMSPKERAEETGISKSSIYYKANLLDQAGEEEYGKHNKKQKNARADCTDGREVL